MEREYKDLVVNEPDGGVYFELVDRAGKTALGPVRARLKSPVKQQGDRWNAAAANLLLRLDEAGRPKLCIPPQAVGGLCPCTHQKAGNVHRLTGEGENLRFAATADFAGGDTFTFNGRAMTARTLAGEPLWPGYFKAGSVVVCHKNGDSLTFSGGGLGSADKKTAKDFLPETKSLLGGSVRGTVPVLGTKRWIPTSSDQQIPAGRYTGGVQTVAGDSSLQPQNIKKDVSLFGVLGSYEPIVYLGENQTFDLKRFAGYQSFTVDNFIIELPRKIDYETPWKEGYKHDVGVCDILGAATVEIRKSYDAANGILSAYCYVYAKGFAAGVGSATGSNNYPVRAYLKK